jgi:tRNA threonylcarbamoyladenosine biosynthesis protein TsaE
MSEKIVTIHSRSAAESELLGEQIGSALESGSVVALIGELAAGKTTLTKGIARGIGVPGLVHSPTFTLIHEHVGRLPVYHFDLYRLTSPAELEEIGYESYFYGEGISIIEWAEKAMRCLPPDHLEIRITAEDDGRTFEIKATGPRSSVILEKLNSASE